MLVFKQFMVPIDFHYISLSTIEVNGNQQLFGSSKFFKIYIFYVQHKKRNVYRFGTTREWVNDDKMFISGLNISLKAANSATGVLFLFIKNTG